MKTQESRVNLTAGRVDSFTCPNGKTQAFLWDTDTPTLALRATPTGRKTYVFEAPWHLRSTLAQCFPYVFLLIVSVKLSFLKVKND
jgi:hypothetical protein